MLETLALLLFGVRVALHVGIIALIWRFDDQTARYRPGVGIFAAMVAAINGWAIYNGFRMFYMNGMRADFDPTYTAVVLVLFLAVYQLRGNVAMMLTPIIKLVHSCKGSANVSSKR